MKNGMPEYRFVEWFSADEIHETIKLWQSELDFIKDEQLFLNELVQIYAPQLLEQSPFEKNQHVIAKLKEVEKDLTPLNKKVQIHKDQIGIMMDTIDQLKLEKAYVQTHKELLSAMKLYSQNYRRIKGELFKIISLGMNKNKRLLG